ncbi:MAG: dihydroorotase [Flavobacteriales bacterium]|nr:dihydroorotase [Flavobacteriales bacterium]
MSDRSILIKRGTVIDPASEFNRKEVDILIKNGVIDDISTKNISAKAIEVVDAHGLIIMPGMADMRCQLKEPGYEHQETIKNGCEAATFSGFTALAVQPTTLPLTQTKAQIEFLKKHENYVLPDLLPIGCASHDLESGDITEMFDMTSAGAVGFSNGDKSYKNGGVLLRALLYSKQFGGLIMSHALDETLVANAQVNESATTVHTGLKQQPDIVESTQLLKEIEIADYAEAHIHFSHISSAKSVEIIRKAKRQGKKISCDVSIWHLVFNDTSVVDYNTNYKVSPPFRTEKDRKALIKAVNDGTIDAIVSDHNPQNIENKLVEFDYARNGINGFQTFLSVYSQYLSKEISLETWVKKTSINPRKLLNQPKIEINKKQVANLFVADLHKKWLYDKKSNLSVSTNNPLFGGELTGKCIAVVNGVKYNVF